VGWWIYVPIHELSHAAGCVLFGGTVRRIDIPRIHGGGFLSEVFPVIAPSAGAAARLAAFDTGGSDLVYLATDLAPFILTIFPGVWLLRLAASSGRGFAFGASLPLALAPFLSLTGDAYEIGSIVVTNLSPWSAAQAREALRGDDLFRVISAMRADATAPAWGGLALATSIGLVWAFAIFYAGALIARLLRRG
jgi:hypothetical protein